MRKGVFLHNKTAVYTFFAVWTGLWASFTPQPVHATARSNQAPQPPFEALETENISWKTVSETPPIEAKTGPHSVPHVELPPAPQAEQEIAQPDSIARTPSPDHEGVTTQTESQRPLSHEILPPQMPEGWTSIEQVPPEDDAPPFDEASWIAPEAIEKEAFYEADVGTSKEKEGTHIRFSFLPDPCLKAADDVKIAQPKPITPRPEPEAQAAPQPQKKKDESCVAFSKARQRQLDALESDRQTLLALRNAMKDLGLTKQLSFVAEGASSTPEQTPKPDKQAEKSPSIEQ